MKAFISYSHRDQAMLDRLHTHLAVLQREGGITKWYDREILAGDPVDQTISAQLDACDLFLALVSPDFLSSSYCYETEMQRAIQRHTSGQLRIVPIILEPCDWQATPLKQFKAVPKDGKPISEWTNQNTGFLDVVTELRRLIDAPSAAEPPRSREQQASPAQLQPKYRVKRTFDHIDRDDFRRKAYRTIKEYFESSISELDSIDGIRARFEELGPLAFTCTVLNHMIRAGRGGGQAHITLRATPSRSGFGLGDLYYSFQAHAPDNVSNGGFSVASDEYNLFLKWNDFASQGRERTWSPEEAAHRLWEDLLDKAGISYG